MKMLQRGSPFLDSCEPVKYRLLLRDAVLNLPSCSMFASSPIRGNVAWTAPAYLLHGASSGVPASVLFRTPKVTVREDRRRAIGKNVSGTPVSWHLLRDMTTFCCVDPFNFWPA